MKKALLKSTGQAILAIAMVIALGQIPASAQDSGLTTEDGASPTKGFPGRRENDRRLEGSWNIQVTRRNCQTGEPQLSFQTMSNFNEGGTMQDYGIAMAPTGRGPSFGVWSYESGRHFTNNFQFFLFGADGSWSGRQIVRRQIELSRSGNSYTATGAVQVFDIAGTVIATVCTTETATRFE